MVLSVWLRFSRGQYISKVKRDILLLKGIVIFFNCGYVVKYTQGSVCEFVVKKLNIFLTI